METSGIIRQSSKKLLIVDGHSYAYRAYYAIRQLSSPSGKPTNAIYGFIRMLNKMRTALNPSHAVVVWDGGLAEERMALLPTYKAHRPETPPALDSQFEGIDRYLRGVGIAAYVREGVEADDWIATLTVKATAADFRVVIASADKDFLQLISPQVGLLNPNDKTEKIWSIEDVRTKTGVNPEQIVDWLSLIGDTVDNIPGVPGIGPTRAAQLLNSYGSIENLYRNLDQISSERIRLALKGAEADVLRNQKLVGLHTHLPDTTNWDELEPRPADRQSLLSLYDECGFKTLSREIQEALSGQGGLL